jgi:hypothetical protein
MNQKLAEAALDEIASFVVSLGAFSLSVWTLVDFTERRPIRLTNATDDDERSMLSFAAEIAETVERTCIANLLDEQEKTVLAALEGLRDLDELIVLLGGRNEKPELITEGVSTRLADRLASIENLDDVEAIARNAATKLAKSFSIPAARALAALSAEKAGGRVVSDRLRETIADTPAEDALRRLSERIEGSAHDKLAFVEALLELGAEKLVERKKAA